ncbi:hypothetical protein MOE00_09060 [Bacillus inaquosorum]|uniref:hypothetical protein n=1 Tax=Bacillus inaquosorum TaxID=483913 RepID=UPI002281D3B0|nr:hypothetical protein [Bacillus inaquosorum]MCY7985441.1 hypothetical protein [Bacillus inaquosorum]MCY8177448.1 hypothetical protein [Bacillus inaquosorum]MCY8298582.1 hypothetical protein [Bacillus inaquosorum]MCY8792447.1 hypothetical protein [Bacillus inaquosorum]MCY8846767.1 hypothetical protein [Bacillus inaquosorum]
MINKMQSVMGEEREVLENLMNLKENLNKEKLDLLLLRDQLEIQVETNKDTSFFYNIIVTVFISALTLLCTVMVCYVTVSAQVMNSIINMKVNIAKDAENFKKMSSSEQDELLTTEVFSPVKEELKNLLLESFFPYISVGIIILLIGIIIFMFWYRGRIKRARNNLMVINKRILDIENKEKELE